MKKELFHETFAIGGRGYSIFSFKNFGKIIGIRNTDKGADGLNGQGGRGKKMCRLFGTYSIEIM